MIDENDFSHSYLSSACHLFSSLCVSFIFSANLSLIYCSTLSLPLKCSNILVFLVLKTNVYACFRQLLPDFSNRFLGQSTSLPVLSNVSRHSFLSIIFFSNISKTSLFYFCQRLSPPSPPQSYPTATNIGLIYAPTSIMHGSSLK